MMHGWVMSLSAVVFGSSVVAVTFAVAAAAAAAPSVLDVVADVVLAGTTGCGGVARAETRRSPHSRPSLAMRRCRYAGAALAVGEVQEFGQV
ncbi:hypothetical protein BDW02DRAFT_281272 [Decorospora gaudefroyi]|uniref:Secreted protein n=1 Tax=Decorospora gaudefroyi TaxID=184978 RepID=A0A6A5KIV2_9PLEO|nr:hypothetical protein BDW02DRAFT_281272 [Decorospora gaudefroyi]